MVSSHMNKSTKDNLKFHSQHSSTGSPTIVYFKLAQLYAEKDTSMQILRLTHGLDLRLDLRLVGVLGGRITE